MHFDTLITNGRVIDGSGGPEFHGSVGLNKGSITAVGDLDGATAEENIDAAGLVITPGFIDVHTHSDIYILIEPTAPSKLYQGITTEIAGNCGASAAPLPARRHLPADWRSKPLKIEWTTVSGYRDKLRQEAPAINIALLAGHNTMRSGLVGYENRCLSPDELKSMQRLLEEALEEGALGLSSGLAYAPGMFAPPEELRQLAATVARHNGIYTSHMRCEATGLPAAVKETLEVAVNSGVRVQISHLKAAGRANWPFCHTAVEMIQQARDNGVEAAADRYPYTYSATDLDVVFPPWAAEGGREHILQQLAEAGFRDKLTGYLRSHYDNEFWNSVTIGSTTHADNRVFRGCRLPEAAANLGLDPAAAVIHFARSDGLMTGAFFDAMSEENMEFILAQPWVMPGSDASLRATSGPLADDYPHPRAYGTFPRYLRWLLDKRSVSLTEGIHRMTALPAQHFRLGKRGLLKPGYAADITVIDPQTIRDTAVRAAPHQYAEGIRHVFVNGVHVLQEGIITGRRGGGFIARQ